MYQTMDEHELKESAIRLEKALEREKNANIAKSRFLANTSHEMRTPLNAIIGLSELTLGIDGLHKDAIANLEKIYNAGITLLSTVNDILDISKIESGKLELAPIDYDVPNLIFSTVSQSIMRSGEKPIQFVLTINENLPARIFGDDLRIKQIINNLLSNAFKYTREGKVELEIRCTRDGDALWMVITVSDTGIGIKEEDLSSLFADYSQVDSSSNRAIEGTGLGLSITKKLIEMMDGSISVKSEYGKGSVFSTQIRQKAVGDGVIGAETAKSLMDFTYADPKRQKKTTKARAVLNDVRVLVVDDVLTNLEVAQGILELYGMAVDCVNNGLDAIAAIRDEKVKYNAIFMDHMMPGMDGIEAAREIRKLGTDYAKNIPLIVLTANAIVGNEEMFLSNGFQAFVSKPIDIARLDVVIREWIGDKLPEKQGANGFATGPLFPDTLGGQDRRQGTDRRAAVPTIPGVDVQKGIKRLGGNEETFLSILRTYAKETRSLLEKIQNVTSDNLADYAITIHGIKGSSRSVLAEEVGGKAEKLELAAKAGELDFVLANNPAFLEAAGKLITDIEAATGGDAAKRNKPKKEKPDGEILARLVTACNEYNIDEIDRVLEEMERYQYEADDGLAVWLRENVEKMNFQEIVERLSIS